MAKTFAIILGIIVLVAGLLGFISNPLVGAAGFFMTNGALDIVYIVIGLVLLAVALWAPAQSGMWLKVAGVVYLVIWILALVMGSPVLGILATSRATDWLHLLLGILMLAAGFWGKESGTLSAGMPMSGGMNNMPAQNSGGPRPM